MCAVLLFLEAATYTIDRVEERRLGLESVDRGSTRQSFLKGRENLGLDIANQSTAGTVSFKATPGKLPRDGMLRVRAFPRA